MAGIDYIRRKTSKEAYGLTIPLLCSASGEKFGKSTGGGCLWLDPHKTSPYQLFQYIMNVPDQELESLLLRLTFHSEEIIFEKLREHLRTPESRLGQKFLAHSIVKMVHGSDAARLCERNTDAFFELDSHRLADMSEVEFLSYFSQATVHKVEKTERSCPTLSALLVQCGLRKTRSEAKRVI